ncbi:hypothetical protein APA_1300 [Pseudanabaena sp. lw0831]|uniref:hypothetical protein n=1 Tax=Pseudanabaena sp. lw0831 TaxID=1357935 RepID=UPI001916BE38|nr:hypothetical protein [Pseudanabaena sp. lw0831]GBO53393.1 hypothetical protein APA_1300 [Pseudanabaena sp. lw0831]
MATIESSIEAQSLSESQWQAAHAIAIELVKSETDVNELGKAIAYLRAAVSKSDAGSKFFKYIKTLVSNGKQIGHSGKTLDYYRSIENACDRFLRDYQADGLAMLQVLGWTSRLMRYYKTAPIGELEAFSEKRSAGQDLITQKQAEIKASAKSQNFAIGQIVEAKIVNKKEKGKEITYEIIGTIIKLSNKEPKIFDDLSVGQTVMVSIVEMKDENTPKKLKYIA